MLPYWSRKSGPDGPGGAKICLAPAGSRRENLKFGGLVAGGTIAWSRYACTCWLRAKRFPSAVWRAVELHVDAKRLLTSPHYADGDGAAYYAALSDASKALEARFPSNSRGGFGAQRVFKLGGRWSAG